MPQQKISSRKATRAFWALKWLLLCMRSLMALEMFKPRETPPARSTDVWPGLVSLWWRELSIAIGRGRRFTVRGRVRFGGIKSAQF